MKSKRQIARRDDRPRTVKTALHNSGHKVKNGVALNLAAGKHGVAFVYLKNKFLCKPLFVEYLNFDESS